MLRPETYHCLRCGYDLTGLPETSKCPECGNPYSTRSLLGVKVPEPGYSKGEKLFRRVRTISLVMLALTLLTCGGVTSLFVPRPERAWAIGGLLALVCILAAVTSYVYEKE